jgi:hypothetical protein
MRALISFLAVVLFCSGCGHAAEDCRNTRTCPPPSDAGAVVVVSDAGVECNGACAPALANIAGWSSQPFILWRGQVMKMPTPLCPHDTKATQLWYSTPVQTPLSCPTCSCEPSTGSCALPGTIAVSASSVCPSEAGDAGVPFDPPSDWDGGCTTNDAILAVDCDGGPCVATVGPMDPIDAGCAPIQAVVPKLVTWGFAAYGCAVSTNNGTCDDIGQVCAPKPPTDVGFSLCVSRQGDDPLVQCPPGYPHRSVFYLGGDDERGCAPCECGPPQGESCSSLVSLYSDDVCTVQVGSVTALSSGPMCVSIPNGSPLGSKQATAPVYTSGSCQASGGEPTGSVQSLDPFTFCCQE